MSLEGDNMLSWFDRNEFNCGAIHLPQSTEDLFTFMKTRHLNFFESIPGKQKDYRTAGHTNWKFSVQ